MKHSDFKIGRRFVMSGQLYLCTDIGTRTIVAVGITRKEIENPSWLHGPPYGIPEYVIDENDQPACEAVVED
jgi:hypothetical protein